MRSPDYRATTIEIVLVTGFEFSSIIPLMNFDGIKIRNPQANFILSGLIVLFFIGGIIHHALPFSGMTDDGRSPLWHGFNTALALSGIFSVLSARQLGWFWLMTLFLTQAAVELRGSFLSVGQPFFVDQVIETSLNFAGLIFLCLSHHRYRE